MKNRVLRLAIVALLVVAMVLTMAACGPKDVVPTTTPDVTTAPTTPTVDPTTTPDVTSPEDDTDAALAKSTYGIEVINVEKTFDAKDSYVVLKYDATLLENYKTITAPNAVTGSEAAYPFESVTAKVSYDGDHLKTAISSTVVPVYVNAKGEYVQETDKVKADAGTVFYPAVLVKGAGAYEVEFSVDAVDNGFAFGNFGMIKDEDASYSLVGTANIAKADVVVTANNIVAPVVAKGVVNPFTSASLEVGGDYVTVVHADKDVKAAATTEINKLVNGTDNKYDFLISSNEVYDASKVGSFALALNLYKNGDKAVDDIVAIDELVVANFNVTLANGTQNFISAYDWNAVRDTATSIIEIVDTKPETVQLARARYDALTAEQQIFFVTGKIAPTATVVKFVSDNVNIGTFLMVTDLDTDAKTTKGSELLTQLTAAEKAIAEATVIKGFEKVFTDSKLEAYATKFNVKNAEHVAAYTTVKAYYDALSDADKAILTVKKDPAVEGTIYANVAFEAFMDATAEFDTAAINSAKELISGAIGAYNKAINAIVPATSNQVLYTNVNSADAKDKYVQYFISSTDVQSLTAQARVAYDKLTDTQKAVVAADVTSVQIGTKTKLSLTDSLTALEMMNTTVGYMNEVLTHYAYNDLSTNPSPAFASINQIVTADGYFVTDSDVPATQKVFGGATAWNRDVAHATEDIVRAYTQDKAHMDAVIAEYKAAIDYVVAGEAYKAEAVAAFKDMIAVELVSDNDWSTAQIAAATSSKNALYLAMVNAMTMEGTPTVDAATASSVYSINLGSKNTNVIAIKTFVEKSVKDLANDTKIETYAEAIEMFEDLYNLDAALKAFIAKGSEADTFNFNSEEVTVTIA